MIYLILNFVVVLATIKKWNRFEKEMEMVPLGDESYYGSFKKYNTGNFIFPASIIICEVYLLFVKVINFANN